MVKCIFSSHIPKKNTDAKTIEKDLERFNQAKRIAFSMTKKEKEALKPSSETGKPDLRKKENRELREKYPPSIHMRLKEKTGLNDYFANSARMEASAVLRSVMELRKADIRDKEDAISSVREKLVSTKKRLSELEKTGKCCVALSLYEKNKEGKKPSFRMPKGSTETYDRKTGEFHIWHNGRKPDSRRCIMTFANRYLFEVRYLRPKIMTLKRRIRSLEGRLRKLEAKLRHLKEDPAVCFGGKDLFRKQHTVFQDDHDEWKRKFTRQRNRGMTISGRKDSTNGNYVFRYDPKEKKLYYMSISGKELVFPEVTFPYGQELLEKILAGQKKKKTAPVAWRIEDHGKSWIIKCILTLPADTSCNFFFGDGAIGLDCNTDCLAVAETDSCGNLLRHHIIPFCLDGLSSGQAEQVLSKAADEVIRICLETHKPLVMEKLKDVAKTDHYGDKRLNRILSGFAHTKLTSLLESKCYRSHICLKKVNPAFTSQMGKVKYMSRYGLSVHESAALIIARRGMGLKERLPKRYRKMIPENKKNCHHWSHWRHLHKNLKATPPVMFYIDHRKVH